MDVDEYHIKNELDFFRVLRINSVVIIQSRGQVFIPEVMIRYERVSTFKIACYLRERMRTGLILQINSCMIMCKIAEKRDCYESRECHY
jgi:hypothetical protein